MDAALVPYCEASDSDTEREQDHDGLAQPHKDVDDPLLADWTDGLELFLIISTEYVFEVRQHKDELKYVEEDHQEIVQEEQLDSPDEARSHLVLPHSVDQQRG